MSRRLHCRICDGGFKSVLDLGNLYPSNFVENQEGLQQYPLHLVRCIKCNLVQLEHTVELDLMYRQYWYKSSLNPSMVRELANIRDSILQRTGPLAGEIIIDIGCNDGTLLRLFEESCNDLYTIGFDPALNLTDEAQHNCTLLIPDYFTSEGLLGVQAKVITSIAMFYDLEEPRKFIEDIKKVLHVNGVWVVQFQDLMSMMKSNAFDNICHEHLEYYSLRDLHNLFQQHGLTIFDVEQSTANGGSLRAYVCHSHSSKYATQDSVWTYLDAEDYYFDFGNRFEQFRDNVEKARSYLVEYIFRQLYIGKSIYVLGASTKGNTLLQYTKLSDKQLTAALEVNQDKWGKRTIGSNIPIVSEDILDKVQVDNLLVLPWHFRDFFVNKFQTYLQHGGKLVFPLPFLTVISK